MARRKCLTFDFSGIIAPGISVVSRSPHISASTIGVDPKKDLKRLMLNSLLTRCLRFLSNPAIARPISKISSGRGGR
jgi:hypothetical protein